MGTGCAGGAISGAVAALARPKTTASSGVGNGRRWPLGRCCPGAAPVRFPLERGSSFQYQIELWEEEEEEEEEEEVEEEEEEVGGWLG